MNLSRLIHAGPAVLQRIAASISGLDPHDPSQWPGLPRSLLCVACGATVAAALWLGWLDGVVASLVTEQGREAQLRREYLQKRHQAVSLAPAKQQLAQEQRWVERIEQQLPGPAQMDALWTAVQQAGIGRGLQFELWRPAAVTLHEQLVQAPVSLRVIGPYHALGQFAADVAQLPQLVTLTSLRLTPLKDRPGLLSLECTATVFRVLEPHEQGTVRKTREHKP